MFQDLPRIDLSSLDFFFFEAGVPVGRKREGSISWARNSTYRSSWWPASGLHTLRETWQPLGLFRGYHVNIDRCCVLKNVHNKTYNPWSIHQQDLHVSPFAEASGFWLFQSFYSKDCPGSHRYIINGTHAYVCIYIHICAYNLLGPRGTESEIIHTVMQSCFYDIIWKCIDILKTKKACHTSQHDHPNHPRKMVPLGLFSENPRVFSGQVAHSLVEASHQPKLDDQRSPTGKMWAIGTQANPSKATIKRWKNGKHDVKKCELMSLPVFFMTWAAEERNIENSRFQKKTRFDWERDRGAWEKLDHWIQQK